MQTDVSSSELKRIVLAEKAKAVVLFSGAWCSDCRELKPVWDSWTPGISGPILKVEVLRGGPEWKDWDLAEMPTVAVFRGGRELGRIQGTITRTDLEMLSKVEGF